VNGPAHYRAAERLADQAYHFTYGDGGDPVAGAALAAEAQARATLALVAAMTRETPSTLALASRYGAEFDRLASSWRVLEDEHDQIHPDRDECGGVGGCSMMFAAHQLETQLIDQLGEWRRSLAIREGRRPCSCDHHGDHAGCDSDCECAR